MRDCYHQREEQGKGPEAATSLQGPRIVRRPLSHGDSRGKIVVRLDRALAAITRI